MVYKICGGIFLLFYGLENIGVVSFPPIALGVLALLAGIALLAGF